MNTITLLVIGYLLWTFVTLGLGLAYLSDRLARRAAWRTIAEERRKLQATRRRLDEVALAQRYSKPTAQLRRPPQG